MWYDNSRNFKKNGSENFMKTDKKLSPLMMAVRTFHTALKENEEYTPEQLQAQRDGMELFSRLAVTDRGISRKEFRINEMKCEAIRPAEVRHPGKVVMYCHGGGFTCGDLKYAKVLGIRIARSAHIDVVTFAYRLAPEFHYPAPLLDAEKMWNYLRMRGYAPQDIFLAGDSAGGNIVLELALSLKSRGRTPAGLILFSPFTDMTLQSPSYQQWKNFDPILTREYIEHIRRVYLGNKAHDFADPRYSPLFADLTGMPPLLVQAGSHEILRDDSELLAKKWRKAGGYAKLHVFRDGWHVFQQMPILMAAEAMAEVGRFIRIVLKGQKNE